MAHADKLARRTVPLERSTSVLQGRFNYLQIIFLLSFVFVGAANSLAQDLGALAREERARKEAQPVHEGHVYTNDDLARPQILAPDDDLEFRSARKAWKPTLVEVPPEVTTESDPPEIPLGDIARKNKEQKVARQQEARAQTQSVSTSHVYTNDDMARPQILTPEDHAAVEAAQRNRPAATEQETLEILSRKLENPTTPLGDIARLYRQLNQVPEIKQRNEFHLMLGTELLASPMIPKRPTRPPPRPKPAPGPPRIIQGKYRSTIRESTDYRTVTVKRGDSLWRLARQYLGRGSQWRSLLKINPWIRDPNHLSVAVQIRV